MFYSLFEESDSGTIFLILAEFSFRDGSIICQMCVTLAGDPR